MRGIQMILGLLIATQSAFGAIQHGNQTIKGTLNVTGLATLGAATSTQFTADNLRLDGNTLSTTNTNGDLTIDLNGTGSTIFTDLTATTVPYLDASKKLTSSAATPTQLGYLANATSNICGISQSCTLTGKTLTTPDINGANLNFGTASNTNRLLLPKDTTTNLDALTDTQSALAFDTTTGKPVFNNGAGWVEVGSGSSGGGSGINMLSGFNNNAELATTASWSETGGGTLATTSTAANVANGTYAFSYDASAATDYLITDARTVPSGLYGANCLAEFYYKGFDSNITAQVHDGTNVLASQVLTAQALYYKAQINFNCPTSGTLALKFLAGADAAIGYLDEVHLGSANNVSSETVTTGWETFSPTWVGTSAPPSVNLEWRRVGSNLEIRGNFTTGTANGSVASMTLPTGLVIGGSVTAITVIGRANANVTTNPSTKNLLFLGTLGGTTVNFSIDGAANATSPLVAQIGTTTFFDSTKYGIQHFSVPIAGWTATSSVAVANSSNWVVDVNISGANPALDTSAVTAFKAITDGGLTLTNRTQFANAITAWIPCSTTNAPTGTTCSSGTEDVGVSYLQPQSADIVACAEFSRAITNGSPGDSNITFQIVETDSNVQPTTAILQEGGSRVNGRFATSGSSGIENYHVCGSFAITSARRVTLRLAYEHSPSGTVSSNLLIGDASASIGQRDIHWTVRPRTRADNTLALRAPGYYRYTGSYAQSNTVYWGNTSGAYGDFTATGTISTIGINEIHRNGFAAVTNATSNLPGAAFTAPRTGVIRVTFIASIIPGQVAGSNPWAARLVETSTGLTLANSSGGTSVNSTNNHEWPVTFVGYLPVSQGTAYNLKLQSSITSGTLYIGASTVGTAMTVNLEYVEIQ